MGKFRQQRTSAPTAVLDVVIAAVEEDHERNQDEATGKWEVGARKGRILGCQTGGAGPDGVPDLIAVKVPLTLDGVPFAEGQRALLNVELFEWSLPNGKGGVTYRFASYVDPSQFDAWKGVITSQRRDVAA